MDGLWLSFTLGLGSAASPCLLPLYPSFLGYLSGNTRALDGRRATGLLGLLILAGVLTTMLAVAVVLVTVAVPIGLVLGYAIPLVDGLLVVLGLLLLAGRNPFERLPGATVPLVGNPYGQAYLYGLLLGPLALPCAGAFALSLIALSVGLEDTLPRIATFLAYGLGFGLPLVVLSLLAGASRQRAVRFIVSHHRAIEIVGGALLVAVGIWDFFVNLDSIRLTFGL
ncbi:MAG TPA: cytochrome c biogenesis protein CcdA [Clostridia bacterium]|nr:cytochrome c biogenesis protein CcdA [Clostridia bacterium]